MKKQDFPEFNLDWSDRDLVRDFLSRNIGLVPAVIQKYCSPFLIHHTMDELVSEGYKGFLKAAKTFNPKQGIRFSTYVYRCVYQTVLDFARKERLHYSREIAISPPDGSTYLSRSYVLNRKKRNSQDQVVSFLLSCTVEKSEKIRKHFRLGINQNF